MRALSEVENLSLAAILKMESDGLVMQRAISSLISYILSLLLLNFLKGLFLNTYFFM